MCHKVSTSKIPSANDRFTLVRRNLGWLNRVGADARADDEEYEHGLGPRESRLAEMRNRQRRKEKSREQ